MCTTIMAGELVVDWHKLSLTRDEDNVAMEVGKEMMVCLVLVLSLGT